MQGRDHVPPYPGETPQSIEAALRDFQRGLKEGAAKKRAEASAAPLPPPSLDTPQAKEDDGATKMYELERALALACESKVAVEAEKIAKEIQVLSAAGGRPTTDLGIVAALVGVLGEMVGPVQSVLGVRDRP